MTSRWIAVTAVAPLAWGANYVVIRQLLPPELPLWGSALRALPAAALLLLLARALPRGGWWWRSAVLGVLNVGAFFLLIYLAAQALPSSIAASVMALSPVALAGAGWLLIGERITPRVVIGGVSGIVGVLLLIGASSGSLSVRGLLASLGALTLNGIGSVLAKKWSDGTPILATTAWQMAVGGLLLGLVAVAVEGAPPEPTPEVVAGVAFVSVLGTALAFVCWFTGLAHLRAGQVGVIGLLNPVTGVLLGAMVAHESLTPLQWLGLTVALAGIGVANTRGASTSATAQPPT
ncbi:DMT family transporter [Nocardioides caeni]|uniref:EamA family transporter n=1 Tax=Nocardioides caeni TaxID=574700 RepID=A0A4V4HJ83_9ACTN|nr:EamA family transporter [Nocardioides caeni]THV09416.1 EamA family transporter [Nocardioides caeni]